VYRVWWENLRERDQRGESGIDGRIILRWIFRKWDVGARTGSIWLGNRDSWQALVNVVMNLRVP
jgi:hypothetical protein